MPALLLLNSMAIPYLSDYQTLRFHRPRQFSEINQTGADKIANFLFSKVRTFRKLFYIYHHIKEIE